MPSSRQVSGRDLYPNSKFKRNRGPGQKIAGATDILEETMQVFIRGHETTIQSRWRDHIYDRLTKLDRFEDRIVRIEYFLTTSHHHRKGAETVHVIAKVPRKTIDVKKSGETMMEAIDAASKVMEGQIHKLYKNLKTRHRRARETRRVKRGIETFSTVI